MDYLKLGIHKPIRLLGESVVTWLFDQAVDFPEWTSVERPGEGENIVLDHRKCTREETKLCCEVLEVMTGQNTGSKEKNIRGHVGPRLKRRARSKAKSKNLR